MSGVRWGWLRHLSVGGQLFLSYLVVISVGMAIVLLGVRSLAPTFFAQSMSHMMGGRMGGMMAGIMTSAMANLINQAFHEALASSLVVATAVAAGVAVLASYVISQHVANPVRRMLAASRRIAAGHYSERVEPAGSTELSELAESFNQMAASLEETEQRRLALVGDVAHELRTPLATIEGYAEGLLDGVVEPSEEAFATLYREAARMRRLVDDLQELSRAEARQFSLHLQAISPHHLVETTTARLRPQFEEKRVQLDVSLPQHLPTIWADEDRGAQVLTNLLSNAWRYTPSGGRVEVTARSIGDFVEFSVRDNGVGIPAEHLPHIFERFYRVDPSRSRAGGGSGIGLTIARHLVEAQGGTIRAASAGPGQGSTFTFTLPVSR